MSGRKKNFTAVNPALAFMSAETQEEAREEELGTADLPKAPSGYKLNPAFVETKSKRVQLLMKPSLVEKLDKLAKAKGISRNEAMEAAVIEYLKSEEA